jgi:predicted nicotinamide N-methyase
MDPDIARRLAALRGEIAHAGELVTEAVRIPGADVALAVTRPSDTDLLLDQIVDDPEQNLPYWAEIWPSGIALAAAILGTPERVAGRRVLELGCGVGITAAVAVRAGARLTVTDYADEALLLTRMTCLDHAGKEPERALRLNWRDAVADGGYDVVLGADLLYERRDVEPLLIAVERLVAPGGALWLAEPGRPPARDFIATLVERGWSDAESAWDGPWPDANDAGVVARTHWLRRPDHARP